MNMPIKTNYGSIRLFKKSNINIHVSAKRKIINGEFETIRINTLRVISIINNVVKCDL